MKGIVVHISKQKLRGVRILYVKDARADCQLRLIVLDDPVGYLIRSHDVRSGSMDMQRFSSRWKSLRISMALISPASGHHQDHLPFLKHP
jgi:hypothetical protein